MRFSVQIRIRQVWKLVQIYQIACMHRLRDVCADKWVNNVSGLSRSCLLSIAKMMCRPRTKKSIFPSNSTPRDDI